MSEPLSEFATPGLRPPKKSPYSRLFSLPVSAAIHIAILVVGGFLISSGVHYTQESGPTSVEVNLVAAAPAESESSDAAEEEALAIPDEIFKPSPDDMLEIKPLQPQIPNVFAKNTPTVKAMGQGQDQGKGPGGGDGSSAVPGKDSTTLKASRGASQAARQSSSNASPVYPEAARRAKQEGRVVLKVQVGTDGYVRGINIRTSSGYPLLDDAAIKAVRNWRFEPAKAAGISIATEEEIPVRFVLDEKKR